MTKNAVKILLAIFIFFILPLRSTASSYEFSDSIDGIKTSYNINTKTNICAFTILLKWGVHDEESYVSGIRSFISELLLTSIDGIKDENGITFFESAGIASKNTTSPDYIELSVTCLAKDFPKAFKRVNEIIAAPYEDEAIFEEAKKSYLEKYKDKNGVIYNIYSLFLNEFYKYHPYRLINQYSLNAIEKLSWDEASDFIKKVLKKEKICISISGNFDSDLARNIISDSYSRLENAEESSVINIQWEPKASEKQSFLFSSSQSGWILIGYSAPSYNSQDYPAMQIISKLVGQGFSSRLWLEIREKAGLAYTVGTLYPSLEGPGHIMFFMAINPKNAMKTRKLALDAIENLKTKGPNQEEIEIAKAKVLGEHLLRTESSSGYSIEKASQQAIGDKFSHIDIEKEIKQITKEDILKTMNKYFNNPTVIIIRPPGLYLNDTWM